ncbi:hypothetical protein EIZ39_12835 [Ammoniphilus sp. CFH 90114]|nr:hypothetical protein EIZ39_12835 [Ammoniphilus sp. CFH 90114]
MLTLRSILLTHSTEYASVIVKNRPAGTEFTFRQEVGGIQLPHTGCDLRYVPTIIPDLEL